MAGSVVDDEKNLAWSVFLDEMLQKCMERRAVEDVGKLKRPL
jgi:hypothetical protein